MRRSKTQKMVGIAMLAAIGYILMYLAFPVIPGFQFMKVDLSDIPILIATYLFGPVAGITTALIRSLLYFLTRGGGLDSLIGNVTSFVAAISFVLPAYFLTKSHKSKKSLFLGLSVGTLSLTVVMSFMNYYFSLPLYLKILNFDIGISFGQYIVAAVIPFNLIKGVIVSSVFVLVHRKLLPWLRKKQGLSHVDQLN